MLELLLPRPGQTLTRVFHHSSDGTFEIKFAGQHQTRKILFRGGISAASRVYNHRHITEGQAPTAKIIKYLATIIIVLIQRAVITDRRFFCNMRLLEYEHRLPALLDRYEYASFIDD